MSKRPRALFAASIAAALIAASAASPADAQNAARPAAGPTAAETYKNIQVFKDLPASQLHDTMTYMSAIVGGNCQTCHVRGADGEMAFDKDDNDHKVSARTMIRMVGAINAQHFKGEERVTCATCHQGRREPSPVPPLAQPLTADQIALLAQRAAQRGGGPGQPPGTQPPPAAAGAGQAPGAPPGAGPGGGRGPQRPTETVDQVIDRFIDAIGGRDALAKLTSRTRRGTLTNRAGQPLPVTVEETASGQFRVTIDGAPRVSRAVDGKIGWVESGGRVRELDNVETANAGFPADLALGLNAKDRYAALAVRAYDRVNGKAVVVLEGRRPAGSETLYFDRETGLLVRRAAQLKTPLGVLPAQVDYDDYRPVDGVRTPFEVKVTDWESVAVEKFSDVVHNQPLDASRFAKPAAK